jgi:hypothetical protein
MFYTITTSRHKPCNSLTRTFNDSGILGLGILSPFTIDSYIFARP